MAKETWKKYTAIGFSFIVEGALSGAFIQAITEAVKNSTFEMKMLWGLILPIFAITDIIIYAKTGEEIISSILEYFGVDLD